jgi:GNAT superfamily N-acetyltransferase
MILRKANLSDVPKIMELWKEFMEHYDNVLIRENKSLEPYLKKKKSAAQKFRKFARKAIRSKNEAIFMAEVDGKPAGYCLMFIQKNNPIYEIEKLGYISDLFVRKEYQGMGISSRLKDEAFKWFKKKGIKYLAINVLKDNKHAHRVYEKWGFFDFSIRMERDIKVLK